MRILSQDKTASIDESGVPLSVSGNCVIAALNNASFELITLGKYKSKERAMEILADIHTLYEELPFSGSTVFHMPKE
jgi:hypothetical protein